MIHPLCPLSCADTEFMDPTTFQDLQNNALFAGLPHTALEDILQSAVERQVDESGFFFFQGDSADKLYILRQGRAKLIQITPDGQQVLLRLIGPWTLFGVIAMVEDSLYPITCQAAEDCKALSWTQKEILKLVAKYSQLALNGMHIMAEQVQEFQNRYRELATERVERRLARTILRLASQTGRKTPEGILINLPLTRQDLAEMTGTTLYTVSRIFSQWESQGLIQSGRERVVVRYPHGLVRIAEDLPTES
jgi:CRP-like cAMP-binding protein